VLYAVSLRGTFVILKTISDTFKRLDTMEAEKPFYKKHIDETLESLQTFREGLTGAEVIRRLQVYGPNKIKIKSQSNWLKILEPFRSVFMLILGIAVIVSLIADEFIDAGIIAFIIMVTACIYYVQRFSADRVLRALEKHDQQFIEVLRDGVTTTVDAEELAPGDIINLYEGQKVPADARVIHGENVRSDEAMLTGESLPVTKNSRPLEETKQVYEQSNMLFQGSYIISGTVQAVVTRTGNYTEFGQLAALTKKSGLSSPVQEKIDKLISQIVIVAACLAVLVFLLGIYRGIEFSDALRLVLTMSVSAIPEGLPIAISVVLILGMRRMAKYNALVRSMSAIENIGIITTIATDKTGTLTKNQLSVQDVWTIDTQSDLQQTAHDAFMSINQNNGTLHDPLDSAFMTFAKEYQQAGYTGYEHVIGMPFDHRYAASGNTWKHGTEFSTYIKGSPEKILALCQLSTRQHEEIEHRLASLTGSGYRVIALAKLTHQEDAIVELEQISSRRFKFVGLLAVADELRPESRDAIIATQNAGVVVRMITGDHFETAFAIAKKINLAEHRDQVFDCTKMSDMTDEEIEQKVADVRVFARVLPEYKYRILDILKKHDITAMTGDGVNDVPALANAHIGIAMGSGSQIAKESGDIVLLDNNFKTITSAIREGRVIFDNIRRMLFYLLSTNVGEVLTTVFALLLGMPIPLLPVQILWTNLGTDTAMVIPLGVEPAERNVMLRHPRRPTKPILGRVTLLRMGIVATAIMLVALSVFHYFLQFETETYARTMVFSALVAMQLTNAINARSEWQSIFKRVGVRNRSILTGLSVAIALYTLAVFGPLQEVLYMQNVGLNHLVTVWIISIMTITAVNETYKLIGRLYYGK
jgi:P-type Ca2+ transporter type 2C